MALILNLETATTNCSVSVAKDGKILASIETNDKGYSHAENLHVFISKALEEANVDKEQLDAVAVSKGPGSYTGLRIGVSAAKGLCFSLDKPLISVLTLEVLAQQMKIEEGVMIPALDARRMELYAAVYDADHKLLKPTWAEVLTEESFAEFLQQGKVHLFGNGVDKCHEVLQHENLIVTDQPMFPSAKEMAKLSEEKYKKSDIEDVAYFEPYYLKDFIVTKKKA